MAVGKKELRAISVQIPAWTAFPGLQHGFSVRNGGVSTVYGGNSLNLGWTKEDDPARVAANRQRFLSECCGDSPEGAALVTVKQVHSATVWPVRERDGVREGKLETPEGKAVLEGDGLMTDL